MKKALGILTAAAVLSMGMQQASAHDGWSITGKVLTGVAGGLLLAKALEPVPVYRVETTYVAPAPVYYAQSAPVVPAAPVVQPAPVYQSAPASQPAPTVVYQQQPVYYQTAPVYVSPAPVYYYPRYYAPVPVISFGFGGGRYYRGGHWR